MSAGAARGKLATYELTFIAENLGRRDPPPLRYLAALARHVDPVVREGVVYGLAPHAETPLAAAVLGTLIDDPNSAVRTVAREALA